VAGNAQALSELPGNPLWGAVSATDAGQVLVLPSGPWNLVTSVSEMSSRLGC